MTLWTACSYGQHVWMYVSAHTGGDPLPGSRCDCGAMLWGEPPERVPGLSPSPPDANEEQT